MEVIRDDLIEIGEIAWVRVWQRADLFQTPKDRVACKGALAVFLRNTDCSKAFLMDAEDACASVEKVEDLSKLNILPHNWFREVESQADLLSLMLASHWPETLEFGIVK